MEGGQLGIQLLDPGATHHVTTGFLVRDLGRPHPVIITPFHRRANCC